MDDCWERAGLEERNGKPRARVLQGSSPGKRAVDRWMQQDGEEVETCWWLDGGGERENRTESDLCEWV